MKPFNLKSAMQQVLLTLLLIASAQFSSANEIVTYYVNDALGSPIMALNQAGDVVWQENYQPYGQRQIKSTAASADEQFYTGKQEEPDIGLQYFGARWYDPDTGRFTSIDPVGVVETNIHSFNRYAYANNNPYRYVDPDGRETNPVSGKNFISDLELRTNKANPKIGKYGKSRSSNNWNGGNHEGVDIAASNGSKLVAPISGKVTVMKNHPKGGNAIWITSTTGSGSIKIGMAHLKSINVKNGSSVIEGDSIGEAGSTGNAKSYLGTSEEHVHLSVRVNGVLTDPQQHFQNNPKKITQP